MFKLRVAIGCLLIMGIQSPAVDPKYQKKKIRKDSPAQKAQSLKNILIQYRKDSNLSHLHELATADTAKITEGLKNILPEATFNTIDQTLSDSDLDEYLNSSDGQAIKAEILKEIIENLCYMCAAFDGFSYAFLTGTIKKDDVTGVARIKNAISWLGSWFQRKAGYRSVHDIHDKEAFKNKNNAFANEFLERIVTAITLYNNSIVNKFSSAPEIEAYAKGELDILKALGTQKAQAANLYKKNPQLEYRYELIESNHIKLADGTEIFALIDSIDAKHKKEYRRIIGHYRTILAVAYKGKKKQQSTKADEQFQKMQVLARKHTHEINQLKAKVKQLKGKKQTPETTKQILALDKQIRDSEALDKKIRKTLQNQYDTDKKASGIYSK